MRVELIDRRTIDPPFGNEAARRCRVVVVSYDIDACTLYSRWDNKGWYFYKQGTGNRVYAPTLKAAIATWRLTR